ncbi:hypothetical protein K504DRAFT_447558 [Pleomassaria siparia CBS 279.74]|uniref:Uncharacterized protein n=1 Tax=Pleomassaria siparia CBS 279.74 TaxID=1314801 RepID=A0A6G1K2M5_9PLEO|nr:hypothetical protein K504DRAFT_447558 [Pleomassaria siparia CBS 279.74]
MAALVTILYMYGAVEIGSNGYRNVQTNRSNTGPSVHHASCSMPVAAAAAAAEQNVVVGPFGMRRAPRRDGGRLEAWEPCSAVQRGAARLKELQCFHSCHLDRPNGTASGLWAVRCEGVTCTAWPSTLVQHRRPPCGCKTLCTYGHTFQLQTHPA